MEKLRLMLSMLHWPRNEEINSIFRNSIFRRFKNKNESYKQENIRKYNLGIGKTFFKIQTAKFMKEMVGKLNTKIFSVHLKLNK